MRFSRVKEKMRQGKPAMVVTCHVADPAVFEMTSLIGFDGIWIDLEHRAVGEHMAANLMRAARVGVSDIIARPAKGEFMQMGRLLEVGAQGIMYPRCETAEEAAEVVRWAKFAPMGERGVDGANADANFGTISMPDYLRLANEHTLVIIQLESQSALQNAEAIASVPGVDCLMLGPGDLSVLSGIPYQFDHPIIQGAYETISAAAKKTGKWWGTVSGSPEHTRMLLDLGALFICHNADILILRRGLEAIQSNYAPLGFTFENRLAETASRIGKNS
jgi:4-hydroxy-2-oxoheptanedioate aldolase